MTRFVTPDELKLWHAVMQQPSSPYVHGTRITRLYVLDLHGYSVQDAYIKAQNFLDQAYRHQAQRAILITGKSGQIRDEISHWLTALPIVRAHNFINDGAVAVSLNTKRKTNK